MEKNTEAIKVIDALGGVAEVARLFDISMPSVSEWKNSGIPKARLMYIELAKADKLHGIDMLAAQSQATNAQPHATQEAGHA